ncbi:hypothetical protein : Uncharacterized protein OS=Planctomyces maris DSM 8797 GN=PM8797T_32355 PE=4 SV=1 [Gemmataceae bacterium]|nr:hypothetical protein : Uncharacterized protein OS=Planctomyces maris DSM 8797 GN=PM8797T_32355 PE=4 SV=1 [Gemmataceae bacterium]VTT96403.1 hypothetical protein : Uncharacterized protein OS=Planctomyces maris DSM 8797 GN=PM8797T_32355 PE=4 SV=1 [Gemmataceae bacterium]
MKTGTIAAVAAACVVLADCAPARAQFVAGPVYRGGFPRTFVAPGFGFGYRGGFYGGGFVGGYYSRSAFFSPFGYGFGSRFGFANYYGGVYPGFPLAPVLPAIAPVTPFGFGPGFLGPGWGVGPAFGWNPVWGGALGWSPYWGAPVFGPGLTSPFVLPPPFVPPPFGFVGNADAGPNGNGVAAAGGVPPRQVAAAQPAPGPVVGAGGFLVIEPKRDFPPPGVIVPDVARVAAPPPPGRPEFRFDPFADPVLVKSEKPDADPAKELARLLKLGREAFANGEYGTAIDRFNQAIAADARAAEPHLLKAQAEFAAGNYAVAAADVQAGLALDPAWPAGAFDPKEPYGANAGAFAGHLAQLRKAMAANPAEPALAFLLGYELWFVGERAEAKRWFGVAEKRLAPGPIALFK